MRAKPFTIALLSALVLLGLALAGPASAAPRYWGYNEPKLGYSLTANQGAWLSGFAGGANVARVGINWRSSEPRKDEYHFERTDEIYNTYLKYGVRPMFFLLFTPSWAVDSSGTCTTQDCPPARANDSEWREFAATVAKRYPEAAGIEVWNEPNLRVFWKPRPDAARYTDLLKQAYRAIKEVNPAMPVVSAGLNNNPTTTATNDSMVDFAKGMYANGAKKFTDALGVHPYPNGLDQVFFRKSLNDLRGVRNAYGDSSKKLWVTEFGFTTTGSVPSSVTADEQASGLVSHWRALKAMSDVDLVAVHELVDSPGVGGVYDASDPEVGYGVLDRDLKPKPAFCALSAEWGKPSACG